MSAPLPALSRIAAGLAEIAAGLAALAAGEGLAPETLPVPAEMIVGDTGAISVVRSDEKPVRTRKAKTQESAPAQTEPEELKPEPASVPAEVTAEALRALCRAAAAKLGVAAINVALGGVNVADMSPEQRIAGKAGVEAAVAAKDGGK